METPLQRIADPQIEGATLNAAILELGPVTEEASFWTAIANDYAYSQDHRRRVVFALFQRHAPVGITLGELTQRLQHPTWLRDEDIAVVTRVGGKLPVLWSNTDTIFVLGLFPQLPDGSYQSWSIYLKVEGKVERDDLVDLLRTKGDSNSAGMHKLMEVGLVPQDPFESHVSNGMDI